MKKILFFVIKNTFLSNNEGPHDKNALNWSILAYFIGHFTKKKMWIFFGAILNNF